MVESQSGSRVGCVNPACWAGSHMGSRVGTAGSHQLRWDPAIPTWDPGWDWRDPTYIPPQFLPGKLVVKKDLQLNWLTYCAITIRGATWSKLTNLMT